MQSGANLANCSLRPSQIVRSDLHDVPAPLTQLGATCRVLCLTQRISVISAVVLDHDHPLVGHKISNRDEPAVFVEDSLIRHGHRQASGDDVGA